MQQYWDHSFIKSPLCTFQPCALLTGLVRISRSRSLPKILTFPCICSTDHIVIGRKRLIPLCTPPLISERMIEKFVWCFIEASYQSYMLGQCRLQLLVYKEPIIGFFIPWRFFQSKVLWQTLSWLWQQPKTWRYCRQRLFEGTWTWFVRSKYKKWIWKLIIWIQ